MATDNNCVRDTRDDDGLLADLLFLIAWIVGGTAAIVSPTLLLLGVLHPILTTMPASTRTMLLSYGIVTALVGVVLLAAAGNAIARWFPSADSRCTYTWPAMGFMLGLLPASVGVPLFTYPILSIVTVPPIALLLFGYQ
jgi:hypothetical protein